MGFDFLKHLSHRLSSDAADQEEFYHTYVQTIFEHFESHSANGWSSISFAKLIFFIIVNNEAKLGGDLSFDPLNSAYVDEFTKDWQTLFRNLVSSSAADIF